MWIKIVLVCMHTATNVYASEIGQGGLPWPAHVMYTTNLLGMAPSGRRLTLYASIRGLPWSIQGWASRYLVINRRRDCIHIEHNINSDVAWAGPQKSRDCKLILGEYDCGRNFDILERYNAADQQF